MSLQTAHPYTLLLFVAGTSFFLGLVDDVRHLAPPAKLAGQVLICAVFMGGAGPGPFRSPTIDGAIGAFWIVGLMNAFNFLDNMDGILSGVSLAVIAGFAAVAWAAGGTEIVGWLLPLAGALAGFLVFNFPPAKIFLGDAGSLLLGGALAAAGWSLASFASQASRGVAVGGVAPVWFALPLAVVYPIFDMTFVTITRLKRGQSPWVGGRDHTTHRLATWLGEGKKAALAVYGLALVGGLAAWVVAGPGHSSALIVFGGTVVIFALLGIRLARVPVS
jgi:UDP-GlcNAc:undecaprenyl-phosphate GlcNAc-1-phosphate transferase